jgi:hypothetical protein
MTYMYHSKQMKLSITTLCDYAMCHYAECRGATLPPRNVFLVQITGVLKVVEKQTLIERVNSLLESLTEQNQLFPNSSFI